MKSALMLGVNPNAERQKEDFYATDPKALKLFLDRIAEDGFELKGKIWECACGMGHLSEELKKSGYNVKSTDLIDRGYGDGVLDFLKQETREWHTSILTNPPFKLAEQFVEKGIDLIQDGYILCLFLKIQFLEGQKRKILFKKYPPKYVYVYSSRQLCCKDGEFEKYSATTQCYAWYVWEKGFNGETIIRWI
jgi:alpha-glucosidase (family GH31 glycosyl hydrolase)